MAKHYQCPKGWSVQQRLDHYTIPEALTGCHLCWAAPSRDGYAHLRAHGKTQLAHRLSWTIHKGPIPIGLLVLHRCDTPACVNPDHLFLGTDATNNADKTAKNRQARGERMKRGMTAERALLVFRDKSSRDVVAARYSISIATVQSIKTGRSWTHITGLPKIREFRNRKTVCADTGARLQSH